MAAAWHGVMVVVAAADAVRGGGGNSSGGVDKGSGEHRQWRQQREQAGATEGARATEGHHIIV